MACGDDLYKWPQISDSERKFINEFRIKAIARLPHIPTVTEEDAAKFLLARKFDIHRALELYENYHLMLAREGIWLDFDPTSQPYRAEITSHKFTVFPDKGPGLETICLFTARFHHCSASSQLASLSALIYQLNYAVSTLVTQRAGLIFIYDMTHSSYHNFDYQLSAKVLKILRGCFPARLKKVIIVQPPFWFRASYQVLQVLMKEKLRDRVVATSIDALSLHLPPSSLPCHLGGQLAVDHNKWLSHIFPELSFGSNHFYTSTHSTSHYDGTLNGRESTKDGQMGIVLKEDNLPQKDENLISKLKLDSSSHQQSTPSGCEQTPSTLLLKPSDMSPSNTGTSSTGKNCPEIRKLQKGISAKTGSGKCSMQGLAYHIKNLRYMGLWREFAFLGKLDGSGDPDLFQTSKLNTKKNRYPDVHCLESTRVPLSNGEYINANYINGFHREKAYIMCQELEEDFHSFQHVCLQPC